MASLKLLDTQKLIWSPFRSFRAIKGKRRQSYLYYKHATLLKFALYPVKHSVLSEFVQFWLKTAAQTN